MAVLPREVRNQQGGMEDETDNIIKKLIVGECMMTAFVGNDPDTGCNTALDDPVHGPGYVLVGRGDLGDLIKGNIEEGGDDGKVIRDVGEGTENRALKAVGRDSFLELANREGRLLCGDTTNNITVELLLLGSHASSGTHC